jgi:H+/Cl- antiporter ClcA
MPQRISPVVKRLQTGAVLLLQLALLGVLVGLACWPLNLVDHWQDLLLNRLPGFNGGGWSAITLAQACSPVLVMPLLLLLQARRWRKGAGSGIPQTMLALEMPERGDELMAPRATVQRLTLWSLASLALFPLGREGPVVQVGAAVAQALRRRWPRLLQALPQGRLLAIGAGAGLAGGFNTPLMGVIFMAEELCGSFSASLIWPALVVGALAAEISDLGGQAQFTLGLVSLNPAELDQLFWGALLGLCGGTLGGLFARLLFETSRWTMPLARRHPWRAGLLLGGLVAALALLSGGRSGGDGEALMSWMLSDPTAHQVNLWELASRIIGPCLALGAGIPGGLIDPAFAIGAVSGQLLSQSFQLGALGVAVGMASGLAGATQLPVMSLVFALHMAGDQQLLAGVLMASVIGAYAGKVWIHKPIYHALADLMQDHNSLPTLGPMGAALSGRSPDAEQHP